jgi:hypothetical protein
MKLTTVPKLDRYIAKAGDAQVIFKFPNGYGASLIQNTYSYGGNRGLFEIAVLRFDGDAYELCYTTDITHDVLGYLTEEEVIFNLYKILELEPLNSVVQ